MSKKRWKNADEFILGRNVGGFGDDDVAGARSGRDDVEKEVFPTTTVVNPTTNRHTIKRIHPTHVKNVNKNITRVENYYPVTQSTEDINIVEEYDCGSDVNNPRCRRIHGKNHKDCDC